MVLAAAALIGAALFIYGTGRHGHMDDTRAGRMLMWGSGITGAAGTIGYWLAVRKRRIRVEDELSDVRGALRRVELMIEGKISRHPKIR